MAGKNAGKGAGAKAGKNAAAKVAKAEKPEVVEKTQAEIDAEALENAVDATPAGQTDVEKGPAPEVMENEEGVKSIRPSGKFVAIGNLIFNEVGQHVGTESNDDLGKNAAARKAERFNIQHKQKSSTNR